MELSRRILSLVEIVSTISNAINQPPVPQGQNNPLYQTAVTAVRTGIRQIFEELMSTHNFPLPHNWTYQDFTTEVIGPEHINDLDHLVGILRDLSLNSYASHHFQEGLNLLYTISTVLPGVG